MEMESEECDKQQEADKGNGREPVVTFFKKKSRTMINLEMKLKSSSSVTEYQSPMRNLVK